MAILSLDLAGGMPLWRTFWLTLVLPQLILQVLFSILFTDMEASPWILYVALALTAVAGWFGVTSTWRSAKRHPETKLRKLAQGLAIAGAFYWVALPAFGLVAVAISGGLISATQSVGGKLQDDFDAVDRQLEPTGQ